MPKIKTSFIEREFTEFNQIFDHSYPFRMPIHLIRLVVDNEIEYGLYHAAMAAYHLGYANGIRKERKRRQRGSK
jgi:hypothetical protein